MLGETDHILFSQIEKIKEREAVARKAVISLGIRVSLGGMTLVKWNPNPVLTQASERLNLASSGGKDQEDDEYECQVCNANLFISLVSLWNKRRRFPANLSTLDCK